MASDATQATEIDYPGVGDLVVRGGSKYVVSDIVGRKTDHPQWSMRPLLGGPFSVVGKETIGEWEIRARGGHWSWL